MFGTIAGLGFFTMPTAERVREEKREEGREGERPEER
jgi:hypothetical protein